MLPIDPAELSALIDGELPPARAAEVRAAIAQDPELRQAFEQLAALDTDWQARAAAAMFRPRVRLGPVVAPGRVAAGRFLIAAAAVLALFLFRVAVKFQPPLLAVGMEAILLAFLVGWGLRRIMLATDADRARSTLAAAC